jgi:hypothetical protein
MGNWAWGIGHGELEIGELGIGNGQWEQIFLEGVFVKWSKSEMIVST